MSYKLEKPFTDAQRADFICEYQGLNYYEDDSCIIMYDDTVKIVDGEVVDNTDVYKANLVIQEQQIQAKKHITKRQLLIWLYTNKKKTETDILTAINSLTDADEKYLAGVSYSGTTDFYYGNKYMQEIGLALGLTTDELKTMFNEASSL